MRETTAKRQSWLTVEQECHFRTSMSSLASDAVTSGHANIEACNFVTVTQVADAIFEHALPRSAGDSLAKTDAGVLLAVVDR